MKVIHPFDRQKTITSHTQKISKEVLLTNGQVPHITQFAIANLKAGQTVEPHSHNDMYEVFFVVSGVGELKVDENLFQLSKGHTFVIEPNELHSISNTGMEDLVLQYFGVLK